MKLTDLSTARDVGCSCLHLEIGPFTILIDAGIDPKGIGIESIPNFSGLKDFSLDIIILTHCHLDHLGALPLIQRKNPTTPIVTSIPNLTLAPRMLRNSYNVMLRQKEEQGIKEFPLYNYHDIDRTEQALSPAAFGRPRTFHKNGEELQITLHPAGHLLGAAGCEILYKHRKIFITGDTLFEPQRIVPQAHFPAGPFDTVIFETTRGATERPPTQTRESEIDRLVKTIDHTLSHGGSCLIPVFALGRMQEMLVIIHQAQKENKLRRCPIFCSGLGLDLVDYFDAISRKTRLINFRKRILNELKARRLQKELRPGEDMRPKGIYLLGSGMMIEKTPSYKVAATMLEHSHNAICFVGYCDPETPGGKLLATPHGESFVFPDLNYVAPIRAHIDQFDISGHADRKELVNFIKSSNPRAVVMTHGDPKARDWFMDELTAEVPRLKIVDPVPGENYNI